jgi:hypothetical protein
VGGEEQKEELMMKMVRGGSVAGPLLASSISLVILSS